MGKLLFARPPVPHALLVAHGPGHAGVCARLASQRVRSLSVRSSPPPLPLRHLRGDIGRLTSPHLPTSPARGVRRDLSTGRGLWTHASSQHPLTHTKELPRPLRLPHASQARVAIRRTRHRRRWRWRPHLLFRRRAHAHLARTRRRVLGRAPRPHRQLARHRDLQLAPRDRSLARGWRSLPQPSLLTPLAHAATRVAL